MLPLPVVAWLGLVAAKADRGALFSLLLAVDPPFSLWRRLGVPVGRHTDFYGWPSPNALGWSLVVITDLAVWYVVASALAAVLRAVWRRTRRPSPVR
jgi:hypothetical protein